MIRCDKINSFLSNSFKFKRIDYVLFIDLVEPETRQTIELK